jgi:hypothetical protein
MAVLTDFYTLNLSTSVKIKHAGNQGRRDELVVGIFA